MIKIQDNKAQRVGSVVAKVVPKIWDLDGVETQANDDAAARRHAPGRRRLAVLRRACRRSPASTLELHDHEVVGLIGPNGAGKSTLVNLLTGFDRADEGTVELERARRDRLEPPPPRPGRSGADVPAQPRVSRPLGPRERRGRGTGDRGVAARGAGPRRRLLAGLGLTRYADAPAANLPHGDERRLGVARALATRPRFVLMDEPAAGLPEAEVPASPGSSARSATSTVPASS